MSRLPKLLALLLPLAGAAFAVGMASPTEAECSGIVCIPQDRWVCCSPSADDCDSFMIDYCNGVGGPFDQECGWL